MGVEEGQSLSVTFDRAEAGWPEKPRGPGASENTAGSGLKVQDWLHWKEGGGWLTAVAGEGRCVTQMWEGGGRVLGLWLHAGGSKG